MARQRTKKGRPISGWIILDKPYDFGSTEAVSKIKWLFKAQKAGHAGTLDPLASGMLPLALGEATKTVPYVMDGRKIYQFTVTWGQQRTTDDLEGEILNTSDKRPTIKDIEEILPNYMGEVMQVPPQFSAIKIAGERAYDKARSGEDVDIPERQVIIQRLILIDGSDENKAIFEVECGKGTYVRALARDFGQELNCFGYVSALRRSCVMPFNQDQMIPLSALTALEDIKDDAERLSRLDLHIINTCEALSSLPHIPVTEQQAMRIRSGNPVLLHGNHAPIEEDEAYTSLKGQLVAIGYVTHGEFRPKRVFNNC